MSKELVVKKTVRIKASIPEVWEALTNPDLTEKYFFGCRAISDWKVGSPLLWNMTVDGKEVTAVKGVVTAIEKNKLLASTCFTPENENVPSKHTTATYKFSAEDGVTILSVTQGEFEDEETCSHTDASWDKVLSGLKSLLEERHG
jgi:uncharacterized protein YndB with AHSA1/START domain